MCIQDWQIMRHADVRRYAGTTAGGGTVRTHEYDESRIAWILGKSSAGALRLYFLPEQSSLAEDVSSAGEYPEARGVFFRDVGPLVWQPTRFRTTTACDYTYYEILLPTKNRDLLHYIKNEA